MAESDHGSGATASPNTDGAAEAERQRMADEAEGNNDRQQDDCSRCRYFLASGGEEPDGWGECRRYPPLVNRGDPLDLGLFPTVGEAMWCGAWASREPQR